MSARKSAEPTRCEWPRGGDVQYVAYHDEEWGVPVRDDRGQFEHLTLESAQAGLSWACVLGKREGYRRAFAEFDPEKVARFTAKRIEKLISDASIIRNRLKINAAVNNARRFLEVQEEFGTFCDYLWRFVDGRAVQNRWRRHADVPASTPLSDLVSKDLKARGFKFVGSTIIYAHLQATGLVNDHLVNCYRYKDCQKLGKSPTPDPK